MTKPKLGYILPADLEEAKLDAAISELNELRNEWQFQRDRTTSTVRRAILLEVIRYIDARISELRAGDV